MKIDPSTVFVLALTLIAGVFLVWIELHSRRKAQLQQTETLTQIDSAAEPATPLVRTGEGARHKRRRR